MPVSACEFESHSAHIVSVNRIVCTRNSVWAFFLIYTFC